MDSSLVIFGSSRPTATTESTVSLGGDLFHDSLQLTPHKLNGKKKYLERAQFVKLAIDGRGKLGCLTGDMKKPEEDDKRLGIWQFENFMIIAGLLNSMEPSIGKPYLFLPTTKDVWEAVRKTYSDVDNFSQIYELKTKLWRAR